MIDSIIELCERDGRLFATGQTADGERYQACIMLAETDCTDDIDETDMGDEDNG